MRILITIVSLLVFSCGPIISVHHLPPGNTTRMVKFQNEPGVMYSLPKHAYDIKINYNVIKDSKPTHGVSKEILQKWLLYPFPFYEYNSESVEVESIEIRPAIIPDPQATYFARLRTRKLFEEVKLDISLNGYNQISSSSGESSSQALPVITTIASTVAGVLVPGTGNMQLGSQLTSSNMHKEYTMDGPSANTRSSIYNYSVYQGALYEISTRTEDASVVDPIKTSIDNLNRFNNDYYGLVSQPGITDLTARSNILKERIKFHEEHLGGKRAINKKDTVFRVEPSLSRSTYSCRITLESKSFTLNLSFDKDGTAASNPFRKFETLKEQDKKDGYSGIFYRVPMQTVMDIQLAEMIVTVSSNTTSSLHSNTIPKVEYKWTQVSGPNRAVLKWTSTGILSASDLVKGKYIFQKTETVNNSTKITNIEIDVKSAEIIQAKHIPEENSAENNLVVSVGNRVVKYKSADIVVPQFGIIRSLPPTKGYTRNFSYALDPVTGALKSYSTKQKGITNEDAKSVAAAISEIEGMRNKKLERYNTELELKIKQWELQQKIDSLRNN